ncbi:MAG: ParA family protein [Deltaproteobacteria bacterium]|nr:ParA family protein [Deltaproteobacteria bacterium]
MKIIAMSNQKGGVGKTTSAVNIAAYFSKMGHKTLLVDLDPQGNAGSGFGVSKYRVEKSIYHALIGEEVLDKIIRKTEYENLFIAPSNRDLIGAEIELMQAFSRETKLKKVLNNVQDYFDYCFIDCPPSLNLLTVNALTAAEEVLIPVQTEYYALEGISELVHTIDLVKKGLNPDLRILGIFLTMYDSRNNLSNQVVEEVKSYFKDKVFQSIIPRNVKLSESPSHGEPICVYDAKSRGAEAYSDLSTEIYERVSGIAKGNLRLVSG